ncbi:MAG TPA: adenylate/guanylate cyclase domain-containing protein [Candidatus Polarisedimenticolia bacterium]|nr:adenylate/guanylate cyclase domain-containing protein [Candidatus Polarisedimenticolia bacterium]
MPPEPQPSPDSRRLTPAQLAFQASAPLELIDELASAGAIKRAVDGTHEAADVPRVRLAHALASSGIAVADLMHEIETGNMPFSEVPRMGLIPEATGRTYAEFAATFGDKAALLPEIYASFGLGTPPPETAMRDHEEAALTAFFSVWSMVDERPEVLLRAARIAGAGMRHIVLASTDLLDEFGGSPPQRLRRGLSVEEAIAPSVQQAPMMDTLLAWLRERHQEDEVFGRIVAFTEHSLEKAGRLPARPADPPAIAFVDLSGYTERTATAGDELAAQDATALQGLAQRTAATHRGRVVKLLGDGVMLLFRSAEDAVAAVRELMTALPKHGLPAAHAGIATGRVVVRDGDVYGHTVNLASRIASHSRAGELLVSWEVAESLGRVAAWEDAGDVRLKGIAAPVRLARYTATS